jgi:putative endonuclease
MMTWLRKAIGLVRGNEKPEHLKLGEAGEEAASNYLKSIGYKVLGRRVKFKGRYELDIVARDGDVLVFVEVKTRTGELFGRPIDSIKKAKIKSLTKAAWEYIRRLSNKQIYYRFDVVEVIGEDPAVHPEIRHIKDAFKSARRHYF